jgi:predicted permease
MGEPHYNERRNASARPVSALALTVAGGPLVSWLIALLVLHLQGSAATYGLLFVALPFALSVTVGVATRRGARSLAAAGLSSFIAVVSLLIVVAKLAPLAN